MSITWIPRDPGGYLLTLPGVQSVSYSKRIKRFGWAYEDGTIVLRPMSKAGTLVVGIHEATHVAGYLDHDVSFFLAEVEAFRRAGIPCWYPPLLPSFLAVPFGLLLEGYLYLAATVLYGVNRCR